MSKFNQSNKGVNTTTNRCGYPAYKMADKEKLVTATLTTMFGEQKFYGSTDSDIVRLATQCAKSDPSFLCKLAAYARNEMNLRSVSHVLVAIIAREAGGEYTRLAVRNVVQRVDDLTEILSYYINTYGKPVPNALKREISSILGGGKFSEYQLAKYNGGNKSLKIKDAIRLTHPKAVNDEVSAVLKKVLDDELAGPLTWETELSAKGNTKEVWESLISANAIPYMAMLRNLKNMASKKVDLAPVLAKLSDPVQVKKSRQLPFRFYSAYRTLKNEGLMTPEIHKALEKALTHSIDNLEQIKGRTLIAVDVSGSMGDRISKKSDVTCADIASLLGSMASRICEDATVCYFDSADSWSCTGGRKGYRIEHYGKFDSVLATAEKNAFHGGGTDMSLPMKYALQESDSHIKPFDRIIYFSDNMCNSSWNGIAKTVQHLADDYRKRFNPEFFVHAVDLQGYGTQQFIGKHTNIIAGWNENVLSFISLAEAGISTLVDTIAKYEIK